MKEAKCILVAAVVVVNVVAVAVVCLFSATQFKLKYMIFWANMKLQKSYSFASFAFMFELLLWFIVVIKYSILWLELLIIHERHASKKWKEKDSRYSSVDSSALAILSSCGSTFESQVQHPRFFNLVSNWRLKFSLYCGKDKINKKRPGLVHCLKKTEKERKKSMKGMFNEIRYR